MRRMVGMGVSKRLDHGVAGIGCVSFGQLAKPVKQGLAQVRCLRPACGLQSAQRPLPSGDTQ